MLPPIPVPVMKSIEETVKAFDREAAGESNVRGGRDADEDEDDARPRRRPYVRRRRGSRAVRPQWLTGWFCVAVFGCWTAGRRICTGAAAARHARGRQRAGAGAPAASATATVAAGIAAAARAGSGGATMTATAGSGIVTGITIAPVTATMTATATTTAGTTATTTAGTIATTTAIPTGTGTATTGTAMTGTAMTAIGGGRAAAAGRRRASTTRQRWAGSDVQRLVCCEYRGEGQSSKGTAVDALCWPWPPLPPRTSRPHCCHPQQQALLSPRRPALAAAVH